MCLKPACMAGFSKIAGNSEKICGMVHSATGRVLRTGRLLRDSLRVNAAFSKRVLSKSKSGLIADASPTLTAEKQTFRRISPSA